MVDGLMTAAEQAALRAAGLAVFEDRIVLAAQPPIDRRTLAAIAKRCAGPVPAELEALWLTAFGGELDYDLRIHIGGQWSRFSFTELFYPDSDGDPDLWGWIDHEVELAKQAAGARGTRWRGRLDPLPFGGCEDVDRLYVLTAPGPDCGTVHAWQQGLPGWRFNLDEDAVAPVVPGVRALFRRLVLEADPFTAEDEMATGRRMVDAIDALAASGSAGRSAADRLRDMVARAVVDWRAALADGSIVDRVEHRQLACEHAATGDDVELVELLARLGCDLHQPLAGGATMLDHALGAGSLRVARALLTRDVAVTGALRHGAGQIDLALARTLLERGSVVDEDAVFAAVDAGHGDVAELLLGRCEGVDSLAMAIRARERAADARRTAKQLDAGARSSDGLADEHRANAARLEALADRVDPTLRGRN
jgi:hypothetical protein